MSKPQGNPETDKKSPGAASSMVDTAVLVLAVILCTASCAVMLMLNPHSLDVGSVYQGF
jgi:hypothetical protein